MNSILQNNLSILLLGLMMVGLGATQILLWVKLKKISKELKKTTSDLKQFQKKDIPQKQKDNSKKSKYAENRTQAPDRHTTIPSDETIAPINEDEYVGIISGTEFLNISCEKNDNSKFRIFDKQNNEAKFEFCGDIPKALANFNSTFDDICDCEGHYSKATTITNISPGRVQKINGKWNVFQKSKIKIQ